MTRLEMEIEINLDTIVFTKDHKHSLARFSFIFFMKTIIIEFTVIIHLSSRYPQIPQGIVLTKFYLINIEMDKHL